MKNNTTKKITLETIANSIIRLNANLSKKIDEKIEDLALSSAKGFQEVNEKIDSSERKLISQINGLENRIDDLALNRVKYEDFDPLKNRVLKIENKLNLSK